MDMDDKKFIDHVWQNCACFNLRRAARLVTQRFDQAFRPTGLTANQLSILIFAFPEEGRTMSKLAKILGMERTTLTRNVAILEKLGLAAVSFGQDKRERRVATTAEGKEKLRQAAPLWQRVQEEVISLVGQDKWPSLLSGLQEVSRKV